MLAEHSDDVLERMQVLRECQLVLVSGTREPAGVARSSLQVFIGESSLRVIDHRTTQRSGTKRTPGRSFSREERLLTTHRSGGARARNLFSTFTEFPEKEPSYIKT